MRPRSSIMKRQRRSKRPGVEKDDAATQNSDPRAQSNVFDWRQPQDSTETPVRLGTLCDAVDRWLAARGAGRRMGPADRAVTALLESDLGIDHRRKRDADSNAFALRCYLPFWRTLHAISVRQPDFVARAPWPPTTRSVCSALFCSSQLDLTCPERRIARARNLVELFFSSHRNDTAVSTRRHAETDMAANMVVGNYSDGSRCFMVRDMYTSLRATDHSDLDHGLCESEREMGYASLLRWAGVALDVGLPCLAGLVATNTHHDLSPWAAGQLHVRAVHAGTQLISQAGALLSAPDMEALRGAAIRLGRLLDRFAAVPRDLAATAALAAVRSSSGLTCDAQMISRLCPEMAGLVVAARLLFSSSRPVGRGQARAVLCDAARALGIANVAGHDLVRLGLDVAFALAAL